MRPRRRSRLSRRFARAALGLPAAGIAWWLAACGPTEVLVGEAPGVSRIVAGVLATPYLPAFPYDAPTGDARGVLLGWPTGLAAFDDGSLYFADVVRRRIGRVDAAGAVAWPVGRGICNIPGPGFGIPEDVCLSTPAYLAAGADGSLYITDTRAHRVYRFDPVVGQVEVVLGTGAPGLAADGAVARTAPTDMPTGVAVGPEGALYVAEGRNHRVVRIGVDGLVAAVAGSGTVGAAGDGGPARDAQLRLPEGLAWMGDTLYVADAGNQRVRRLVRDTIFAYAGLGAPGFAGDRGPAAQALFRDPGALAVAGSLLFVADRANHRVRIIRVGPDSIDTYGGTGGATPGPDLMEIGRTAIVGPAGLAVGGRAVFVSDSGGAVVRRVVR